MTQKINFIKLFIIGLFLSFTMVQETVSKNFNMKSKSNSDFSKPVSGYTKMTVLYDNYVFKPGTIAKWGFSCLIETNENTILFDTGGEGDVLLHNIRELKVDITDIDIIVISHNHWDHTGGLVSVLESNKKAKVYLLGSFPEEYISSIKEFGNEVILVDESIELCSNVISTGDLSGPVNEQSLIVSTKKGVVVVTGCSHPGIVNIVERAKELSHENVYLVFGGFHLMRFPDSSVDSIIDDFRKLGVEKCGATHCTGDSQIKRFQEGYNDDYVKIGTGKVLEF